MRPSFSSFATLRAPGRVRTSWIACGWLIIAVVLVLSLIPPPIAVERAFEFRDKLLHALAYALLMAWFGVACKRGHWAAIAVALAAYGGGIEFLQGMTAYRSATIGDVCANITGIAVVFIAASRRAQRDEAIG